MKSKLVMSSLLLLSAFSINAIADVDKDFSKQYEFDKEGHVSLENVNGDVKIEGWERDYILLEYTITADNQKDLDRIKVDVSANKSRFSVDVEYGKSSSWFGSNSGSGEVSFSLKVPNSSNLRSIESVNGDVEVEGVHGKVRTDTVNGKIYIVGARGDVRAETVNGNVRIQLDQLGDNQRVVSETVNGDIEVFVPNNSGFRLRSETLNGDLSNDFGIEVDEGEYVGADMNGDYGNGKAKLNFDTVNGDIEVNKK